ncbi:MAG: transcription elongation factor GreA [Candidatus Gracilibacteria bacterium]|nr:transcription elongation factor GreA [bacterium]MDZ4217362.1 transcription elongation factor GreA [Candidatus Gracilibacteria bacterium]
MAKKNDPIIEDEQEYNDDDFRSTGKSGTGDETVLVTRQGLKKLQEELEHLKSVRRKEVADRLKEAISYGDLSENSEYEEAKNEQAFIEGRIIELEHKIKNSKIIKGQHAQSVQMGSEVTIQKIGNKEKETYIIVGTTEADPFEHKISNESPLGKAIIEKTVGERVTAETPSGPQRYEILALK